MELFLTDHCVTVNFAQVHVHMVHSLQSVGIPVLFQVPIRLHEVVLDAMVEVHQNAPSLNLPVAPNVQGQR